MIISKIYNGRSSSGNKRNSISDPRVITPSSIPIFILPPTLDSYANGNKPDLNDSYDCWSLVDDDNLNNNIEHHHKRNSTAGSDRMAAQRANENKTGRGGTTSLENLNKLDIGPKGAGANRNSSISSTASTPNPNADYNGTNTELQKSNKRQQAQPQSQQNCSKSRVKTLFRNGFLNMQTVNNESDEIKSKENYCNQWVLQHPNQVIADGAAVAAAATTSSTKSRSSNFNLNSAKSSSTNLSVAEPIFKSPSINFDRSACVTGPSDDSKIEEQKQREYLVNLLMQLQKEQGNLPSEETSDQKKSEKGKKNKRSKSETMATLNSIWLKGAGVGGASSHAVSNMINRSTSKRSNNRLNSIEKQNSAKSKTNRFLDVMDAIDNGNGSEQRRFSLRNLFSKRPSGLFTAKSSQTHLNKRNSEPENYLLQLLQENKAQQQQQLTSPINHPPKIVNSHCSMSNSSSMTSTSIKMVPVSSVTGSVLKFHRNKLGAPPPNEPDVSRTLSDPNMHKIRAPVSHEYSTSLRLPHDAMNDIGHKLSLLDRRELFKGSKSSSSNNLDDDNDIDKIFNQYIERRIASGSMEAAAAPASSSGYHEGGDNLVGGVGGNFVGQKPGHRRFFSFIFRGNKSGGRGRSSFRNRFKLFSSRHKGSSQRLKNAPEQFEMANAAAKKASLNSNFKFDLHNLNLSEIEKDFAKSSGRASSKGRRGGGPQRGKSDSIMSNNSIYLDASLVVPSRMKKSRSTMPDLKAETSFPFRAGAGKVMLSAFVDVCIERLQQNLNGHLLSISLRNFRTEPLIEINHIKAKFNYLSIELVESRGFELAGAGSLVRHLSGGGGGASSGQLLAKINKIKSKKCKFDHNLKSLSKPVDFDLVDEHFLNVTEEATSLQIRKVVLKTQGQQSTADTLDEDSSRRATSFEAAASSAAAGTTTVNEASKKTYLFLFSVEVHSYLPVSRKILISTFRKKKRIFKGQCQIHENFIHSTQFTKQFLLTEV